MLIELTFHNVHLSTPVKVSPYLIAPVKLGSFFFSSQEDPQFSLPNCLAHCQNLPPSAAGVFPVQAQLSCCGLLRLRLPSPSKIKLTFCSSPAHFALSSGGGVCVCVCVCVLPRETNPVREETPEQYRCAHKHGNDDRDPPEPPPDWLRFQSRINVI